MSFNKKNYTGTDKRMTNEAQHGFHIFVGLISLAVWPCVGAIIIAAIMNISDPNEVLESHPYIMFGIMTTTIIFSITTYILVHVQDLEITFTEYFSSIGKPALIGYSLAILLGLAIFLGFCHQKANQLNALAEMKAVQYRLEYVKDLGSITYVADVLVATPDSILFIQTKYDNKLDSVTSETHQTWTMGNFFHFYGYKPKDVPDKIYNWRHKE